MLEYIPNLLAPKFFILYAFIASGMYVHLRGRVRHRFYRQLTDHSTFMAPYNVLMYMFSAVPQNRGAGAIDTFGQCRDVRVASGGRRPGQAPRSVCWIAALPSRIVDAQFGELQDLRRRGAVPLARRRSGDLR